MAALGALLSVAAAEAEDAQQPLPRATIDWAGMRTDLENEGVDLPAQFPSDFAVDMTGGKDQGFRQAGRLGLGTTLDPVSGESSGAPQVQEVYGRGDTWRITDLRDDQTYFARPDTVEHADHMPALLIGRSFLMKRGASGGYLGLSQQILHRDGADPDQGLAVFLNLSEADRSTATTDSQIAAGLVYSGPFATRPGDAIGLTVTRTHVNSRVASAEALASAGGNPVTPSQSSEYAAELYYGIDVVPGLSVRPNLQYIADPGGASANRTALVGGIKLVASF
jgi:carbohydrate-selective porin OprB